MKTNSLFVGGEETQDTLVTTRQKYSSCGQAISLVSEALACLSSGVQCWFIQGEEKSLQKPGPFIFCTLQSDKTGPRSPREQIVTDLQGVASLRELGHERPESLTWARELIPVS